MIVLSENGYGTECPVRFVRHNLEFGVVVSHWGDLEGAQMAADYLQSWLRTLNVQEAESLHELLARSEAAYGDDPSWRTAQMQALNDARLSARGRGLAAGGKANEGFSCNCFVVALPYRN